MNNSNKTLLDLNRNPTLDELRAFFRENGWSAAAYMDVDYNKTPNETIESLEHMKGLLEEHWEPLSREMGLKSHSGYYGKDNPLIAMQDNFENLVSTGVLKLLEEQLEKVAEILADFNSNFTLANKDLNIGFANIDAEIAKIDTDGKSVPKAWKMNLWNNHAQREFFKSQPPEKKIRQCKELINKLLTKDDGLYQSGLTDYVERVVAMPQQSSLKNYKKIRTIITLKLNRKLRLCEMPITRQSLHFGLKQAKLLAN